MFSNKTNVILILTTFLCLDLLYFIYLHRCILKSLRKMYPLLWYLGLLVLLFIYLFIYFFFSYLFNFFLIIYIYIGGGDYCFNVHSRLIKINNNDSINGQNTEKSPGDLRLAVTQTPVKDHQLTLM